MKLLMFSIVLLLPAAAPAQSTAPDEEGCKESKLVTRMPRCRIYECSVKDFDSAEVVTGAAKNDEWPKKTLEGKTEILNFECPENVSKLSVARNMEGAMRQAGFTVVYSGKGEEGDPVVTGKKGAQWLHVKAWENGSTPSYTQTAVTVQEMQQEVTANADAWAAEIAKSGRVSVYGINFDTGKAAIRPDSEPVLQEIASLLEKQPDLKLKVEGHTDSTGAKAANQTLSQQRAASVLSWLVAKGVNKTRLTSEGLGDSKPVADNATEEGRAKNRRVELVRM